MSKHKPLHTNRKTSPGHRKVPIAQATAGKLYRVRDKDWVKVWGGNLTWADANKLKNQVAARRLSRTVRVEDMAVPPPAGYEGEHEPADPADPWRVPLDASPDIALAQEGGEFRVVARGLVPHLIQENALAAVRIALIQENALGAVRIALPSAKRFTRARGFAADIEAQFIDPNDQDLNELVADLGSEPSDDDIDHALRSADA